LRGLLKNFTVNEISLNELASMQTTISENKEITDQLSYPEAKWGDGMKAGYQILPNALVRGQHLLKLTATDMVVIANLNQAWWFDNRPPFLQPLTIAKRMGVTERTVQRSLSRLRQKKLIRQERERLKDGTFRYYHDLSGLKAQVEQLARRDALYTETLLEEKAAVGRTNAADNGQPASN
jgi:predicted transcriptional regulator